jgi:hypothetical protein
MQAVPAVRNPALHTQEHEPAFPGVPALVQRAFAGRPVHDAMPAVHALLLAAP